MIVKVCGMREPANIRAVEECGVDWIGFIFYPRSPRCLTDKPAYLPQKARRIGVFVDAPREEILLRAAEYGLHGIQLHGNETPDLCRAMQSAGFKVIKALPGQAIDRCARLRRGVRLLSLRLANPTARRLWCYFRLGTTRPIPALHPFPAQRRTRTRKSRSTASLESPAMGRHRPQQPLRTATGHKRRGKTASVYRPFPRT